MNSDLDPTPLASGFTANAGTSSLALELNRLKRQFNSLVWAIFALASTLMVGLGIEVWQLRSAAASSRRTISNLQQIGITVEEFRRLAGRYPELAAVARRHGLEPVPPTPQAPGAPGATPTVSRPGSAPSIVPSPAPTVRH